MNDTHSRPLVLALGFFDGVHLGHGALLTTVARRAAELDAVPGALSFDTHPSQLLSNTPVPLLTVPAERSRLMRKQYGMENVIFAHFDRAMMQMPWREYLTDFLFSGYHAVHLVAGHDHRFGYRGEGTPERLMETCREYGIGCDIVPPVIRDGQIVSSTEIRGLLTNGDVETAAALLGHPFSLTGSVVHGHHLGSRLGFPTVNLSPDAGLLIPARGVYITRVCLPDGRLIPAVTNIGVRPTVDSCDGTVSVESFLLDFSGDLYDASLRLEFCRFLRPECRFDSLAELTDAVMRNAQQARDYFGISS